MEISPIRICYICSFRFSSLNQVTAHDDMVVDGRQTFMTVFDKRCWNRTIISADLPTHHVLTSLAVLDHNRLAVSYFGEKSELKIYDLRMNAWSSGVSIFNKSYKSIGRVNTVGRYNCSFVMRLCRYDLGTIIGLYNKF